MYRFIKILFELFCKSDFFQIKIEMCRELLITENIQGISLIFDIFIGEQNKIRLINSRAFLTMRILDNVIAKI